MRGLAVHPRTHHSPVAMRLLLASASLLAAIVLLGSVSPAFATPRTVRVGLYENEPKIFTDSSTGEPAGIFVDILEAIAKDEGWDLEWVPGTWDEGLAALEAGQIDLMPDVAYSTERDESYDFHRTPVVESWSIIYAAPGRQIDRFSQLDGATVAVLKNSIQHKVLEQMAEGFGYDIQVISVASLTEAFQMASRGEVDAAVANHLFGDYFYMTHGLTKTPVVFNAVPLFYATASGENSDLLDGIDRRLAGLIAEPGSAYYGTLDRYTRKIQPPRVPEWVLWVLGVGAVVLALSAMLAVLFRWQVALRTRSLREANEEILRLNADLERRVAERTAELESANEDLKSFSYSVSHDLRAPLRAISGFAQILARRHKDQLNDDGKHYIDNIVQASERMGHLIEDLLTYSRLGRQSVNNEAVPVAQIADSLASDLASRLEETGTSLEIAEDLPTISADRTLVTQILLNLLENAVTYQRPGAKPAVMLGWRDEGDDVVLYVRDNGIGIPAEYQEKVFNVFQRLHNDDEYPGTGIGLANVKKCVDMLGGKVWVESVVDKGSTFYVRLPKER